MLDHLHIQNYRLFKDLKIDKLGQVNLIAGKNNTGKTALLEALALSESNVNYCNKLLTSFIKTRGEFDLTYNNAIELFCDSDFRIQQTKEFPLFANEECIARIGNFSIIYNNSSAIFSLKKASSVKLEVNSSNTESNDIDRNFTELNNKVVFLPFKTSFNISNLWENIDLTPHKKDVINVLQILDSKIIDVGVDLRNRQPKILLDGNLRPTPIDRFGDGVNRLFRIALCLVNSKNKTLIIDEFETGLHHSVQEQLWEIIFKYAKEWNIQVFVTTHSQDTVKAFSYISSKEEYNDMGQYMRLQPSRKTGEIEAVIYPQDSLENSLDLNLETR